LVRKRFIAGLFSLLPLGITIWLLNAIFEILVGIFQKPLLWAAESLNFPEPGFWQQAIFSIIAMAVLLFVVGALVQNFVGRRIIGWLDLLMLHIPGIKSIYGATKQVMGAIQSGQGGNFKEVALVPWPNSDSKTIGFIAHRGCSWAAENGSRLVAVFVPTSPIPTSGYVIMLDESKIEPLDVTPEQALTWVVSGGVATPDAADKH
jgi:uncharacterized membrane protein